VRLGAVAALANYMESNGAMGSVSTRLIALRAKFNRRSIPVTAVLGVGLALWAGLPPLS
jgi:hypothetical protein